MLLADAWDYFYKWTTKASDVARQLAIAGLAVVWIFKNDASATDHSHVVVPDTFYLPAALMIAALAFDLFQYVLAGILWFFHARGEELAAKVKAPGVTPTEVNDAPRWINWPGFVCFWTKLSVLGWGYVLLFQALAPHIHFRS